MYRLQGKFKTFQEVPFYKGPRNGPLLQGAHCKEVAGVEDPEDSRSYPGVEPAMAVVGISQPKPRLKKTASIDSKLSAHERMKLLMSGGTQQKGSKTIEKAPPQAVAELVQFLIANGIISKQ